MRESRSKGRKWIGRKSAQLASHEQLEHPHLSQWVSFDQSCGWVKENFITTACDPVRPLWDQSNNHIMHHSHTHGFYCVVVNSFSHPSYFSYYIYNYIYTHFVTLLYLSSLEDEEIGHKEVQTTKFYTLLLLVYIFSLP